MARRRGSERGQISIFVGVMLTTFILFFMFVVNVGMLVHAKINIQNAADLAAYAGAAAQARQLNQIGFLNYEMRRQFKKLLFRYHVIGNMAQRSRSTVGDGGLRRWSPDGNPQNDFGVPAICIIFNARDNYCQLNRQPRIAGIDTSTGLFDGITIALNQQLQNLEDIRQGRCREIGQMNRLIASLWLFNADPELRIFREALAGADPVTASRLSTAQGISQGLGLVPRIQLLLQRIRTLEYYLNFPPQRGLKPSGMDGFSNGGDPGARERTAVAALSAMNTLGPHVFGTPEGEEEHIEVTELLPEGGQDGRANVARFTPITTDFELYYAEPTVDNDGNCNVVPLPLKVRNLVIGVKKDPAVLTYYAVKVKAKARLLFSPFGRVTLKAYAAAMPFGSRIGPNLDGDDFRKRGVRANVQAANLRCPDCVGTPNLPLREDETNDDGWWKNDVINEYFQFLRDPMQPGQPIGAAEMARAYGAAMAPNPIEKGKYLIPHDLGASDQDPEFETGNPFMRFFDRQDNHAFWAPIVSPDLRTDVAAAIKDAMEAALGEGETNPQVLEQFAQSIDRYVSQLRSGSTGDDDESFSIVRIRNPLKTVAADGRGLETVGVGRGLIMKAAPDFSTHWNDIKDAGLERRGRIGYSVKFVSFRALFDKLVTANGDDPWTNDLPTGNDADASVDLQFIKH